MLTVAELLDRAKAAPSVRTWYRLARVLDVTETSVNRWRRGDAFPTDEMTARLAELAGVQVGTALAVVHAARQPEGSRLREAWLSLCASLLMAVSLAPAPAEAGQRAPAPVASSAGGLCITSTRRRRLAMA